MAKGKPMRLDGSATNYSTLKFDKKGKPIGRRSKKIVEAYKKKHRIREGQFEAASMRYAERYGR